MKLAIVQLRDQVPTGAPGDNTSRLQAMAGAGPSQGWSLDLNAEGSWIAASRLERRIMIPRENVVFVEPLIEAVEPKAKGKAAA